MISEVKQGLEAMEQPSNEATVPQNYSSAKSQDEPLEYNDRMMETKLHQNWRAFCKETKYQI